MPTGWCVSPGFVDPHTHYDAQLFWDPCASSSSLHGVTSVIAGNCGFTLAPLHARDADYTRRMMAKVEGMPLAGARSRACRGAGKASASTSTAFEGRLGVNAGFLVGHCALRRYVMGEEAVGSEATADEIAAMVGLLHDAIDAGGLGFSTTLAFTHSDGDGQPVASRWASRDEVLALCGACASTRAPRSSTSPTARCRASRDDEVDLMAEMTLAGRRPLNWNVLTVDAKEPDRYREQLAACEHAAARRRQGGRAHDAGARRDEHELRHLLRAVHAARLVRRS